MVAISHCTWKSYLESKREIQPLSLRWNSLVSLCPIVMMVQFVKIIFYYFLLAGKRVLVYSPAWIFHFAHYPPTKKQVVSPFSSLFHIGSFESSAASKLFPGGLRIKNSTILDAFQSILCSWATGVLQQVALKPQRCWSFGTSGSTKNG